MLWLVEPDLPASGERDSGQRPPALLGHRTTLYFLPFQRFHRRLQVVADEEQFVQVVLVGGMKGGFGGRQREDEPAMTGVNGRKLENVPEERTVGIGILAVDDDM